MTRESKIGKVIRLLHQNNVKAKNCTPCSVTEFISKRGITLTVDQVYTITNTYEDEKIN